MIKNNEEAYLDASDTPNDECDTTIRALIRRTHDTNDDVERNFNENDDDSFVVRDDEDDRRTPRKDDDDQEGVDPNPSGD